MKSLLKKQSLFGRFCGEQEKGPSLSKKSGALQPASISTLRSKAARTQKRSGRRWPPWPGASAPERRHLSVPAPYQASVASALLRECPRKAIRAAATVEAPHLIQPAHPFPAAGNMLSSAGDPVEICTAFRDLSARGQPLAATAARAASRGPRTGLGPRASVGVRVLGVPSLSLHRSGWRVRNLVTGAQLG